MADSVRVHLRAKALDDDVDEVILKIFCNSRDEGDSNGGAEQERYPFQELFSGVFLIFGRISVDDVAEDERIEQREYLVRCGQRERETDQFPVVPQVAVEDVH